MILVLIRCRFWQRVEGSEKMVYRFYDCDEVGCMRCGRVEIPPFAHDKTESVKKFHALYSAMRVTSTLDGLWPC